MLVANTIANNSQNPLVDRLVISPKLKKDIATKESVSTKSRFRTSEVFLGKQQKKSNQRPREPLLATQDLVKITTSVKKIQPSKATVSSKDLSNDIVVKGEKEAPSDNPVVAIEPSIFTYSDLIDQPVAEVRRKSPLEGLDFSKLRSGKYRLTLVRAINILAIIGLVYGVYTIFTIDQRSQQALTERQDARAVASQIEVKDQHPAALPRTEDDMIPAKIVINSVDIEAPIDIMGVTETNNIEAPSNFAHAGWFDQSALPGNPGATIIDGHLGGNVVPGIFTHLEQVETGDSIQVVGKDGIATNYIVREKKIFDKDSKEFDQFYEPIGEGHGLNLITCNGGWLPGEQTYDSRLIVYAEQVFA